MTLATATDQQLAIRGGPKAVELTETQARDLFHWPIVTREDEEAVLAVLRAGTMSNTDITSQFEAEYARYQGTKHALAFCNGTAALQAAMFAVGLGRGDELITPSVTYWASALQAMTLGATPVFADIDPQTGCIDPRDIERRITPRTRAILVVHLCGHPADMDPIMAVARQHGVKVIEDASHAHGSLYKGRMVGTIGDVAGMSMMAGKSFAIGEGGMVCTDDRLIYERAIAWGHYNFFNAQYITHEELKPFMGLPLGGIKGRLNQTCAAMGRVQLKHYPQRIVEIQRAMNRFWDLLEGVPGLRPHRPDPARFADSTMGGWYNPVGHYLPEELGGLPLSRFIEAVSAEGGRCGRGINFPLHLHPVLNTADIYHDGKPTRIAFAARDVRQPAGSLPVSEAIVERAYGIPWFKHDRPELIEQFAHAYRKVATQAEKLVKVD